MKLTASMMLSVDGVYRAPVVPMRIGAAGSTAGGGRHRMAMRESWRFLTSWFERADAFLLGRKTWEIWEPYWPHHDGGDPVSHGINVLPKYVPSTTLRDPTWQNTHVINGDVEAAVRELKAKPGTRAAGPWQRRAAALAARARPHRRAQPADLPRPAGGWAAAVPGTRPDAQPGIGRLAIDAVRRDVPDYRPAGRATFATAG